MMEVPEAGEIGQKMHALYARASKTKFISTSEIAAELEPLFEKHGYREHVAGEPQRILLLHDDGVGDFINCSPAIREVRRAYPDAYITLVVFRPGYAMAATCPYVDQVIADERKCDWNDPLALFGWYARLAQKLLPMHFDLSFHFTVYGSLVLLSYLSGAARRIGYAPEHGMLPGPFPLEAVRGFVTDPVPAIPRGTHSVYRYLPLIESLTGKETQDCRPEIWTLAQETEQWRARLGKAAPDALWIAVAIGSTDGRRHYPAASYAGLFQRILEEEARDVRFLLLGGPGDRADGEALAGALPEQRVWNAVGQTSYRGSAAALSCCRLYIGNDTGLMHAAAAARLPVLTPCCYPADRPMVTNAVPIVHYPYGVPAVLVRPAHALPECQDSDDIWGCAMKRPHCITQVTPDLMLRGYHLLNELIRQGRSDLFCIYEMENPTHDGTVTAVEHLDVDSFENIAEK